MGSTAAIQDLPKNLAERLSQDVPLRAPASFGQYLDFAETCEYRVEFSNGNIIAMSAPSEVHELLCGNIIRLLGNLFADDPAYRIYGSNLGVLVAPNAHYKPDAAVLKGEPVFELHQLKKITVKSVVNPFAVVDVFSDGTIDYDLTEKLPNYKKCPSLQYVICIHQHNPFITVYARIGASDRWTADDYTALDAVIEIEGKTIPLQEVYRQVVFGD